MGKRAAERSVDELEALKSGDRPSNGPHDGEEAEYEDEFEDDYETEDEIIEVGAGGLPEEGPSGDAAGRSTPLSRPLDRSKLTVG